MAALHLATRVFLVGNHISDEQRDNEQESRRKAKEHETRGTKILRNLREESLEGRQGRRRTENFNENHRKAERNSARQNTYLQWLACR